MNKYAKGLLTIVIGIPVAIVGYLTIMYLFDVAYTIFLAIMIVPLILGFTWWVLVNVKDVIVSLFKEDKEVDERGFKKNF